MTDFQEFVIAERKEFYKKCEKLNAFISSSIFKSLPVDEQVRIRIQLLVIRSKRYAAILATRIADFYRGDSSI